MYLIIVYCYIEINSMEMASFYLSNSIDKYNAEKYECFDNSGSIYILAENETDIYLKK